MDRNPLIGVSICAVVLLVLASLSNVVGYQTVQSSNQKTINSEVDQKELLFQTIVDIANNKEIQGIILKYQISQGVLPVATIPVLTMKQLRQMYLVGLILSKIISKSRIQSMVQQYQLINPEIPQERSTVIEKDAILNGKITQLSTSECDCENENTTPGDFPILCALLFPLVLWSIILYFYLGLSFLGEIMGIIDGILDCPW